MSHRLTRRTWAALGILLVAIPALMVVFVCVWDERKYYLTSLLLVGLMFVPFVLRFEGRRPQARELVLLSTMTALAVAGRAAFYWLPQCKPVCAIVILTAVAFTPEAGFVTGAAAGLMMQPQKKHANGIVADAVRTVSDVTDTIRDTMGW